MYVVNPDSFVHVLGVRHSQVTWNFQIRVVKSLLFEVINWNKNI